MPSDGKIFFQNISVSGRSIRETPSFNLSNPIDSLDAIKLKYSQNTISLELIPLNISRGSMFSWQLDGFDKDWSPPSANRLVTYTNLPSGQFYLKIRLYDNSLKIVHERSLAIQLIPPIWKKAWFILLISLIILGVLLLGLLYYIKSLKQKHTEEKVRFFTNTAHDIRTSLNLILAPVEELTHEHKLSETGKYFLETAIVQARKLASVVTQLMDFQKVDIGREELNLRMADVVALVGNRKQMYEPFAKNKGIEIEMKADKESYVTAIDENKIEKVIDNLISNAVKYSYSNGKVSIDLQCESNKWILAITDWGIGISKKDQRKLFKEFYRGENAVNSKIVGSGIGLLLAKDYVGMHHGTIKCDSYLNIGSKFIISIPYKEIQGLVAGNFATEPFSYQENQSWEAHAEPVFGHSPNKVMNLLIVEDNEDFCNFLTNSLAGDFKVFTANDGVKAWDLILKHLPDLVVSDIMMPNMDGYGLCQLIKSTFETSHIPVILLSALSDKTNQLHGLGLGADDYLAKPFDMVLLRQKIKSIHHNREIVREKSIKFLQEPDNEPLLINEHNNKFVKKIMEVVWANISNPEFDKEVFASKMNVSSSLLYKKLKSLTGQSPTDFVKIVRIKHASELIISRKYTVTEVSEMCGFSSVGYFSTVFKKFYGKPPTELLS
jgi:signal transduction histidine kinase/AraC-like DNA-binding protein